MIIRKATLADVEAIRNLGNVTKEFATSEGIVIFRPKEVITNCIDKDNVILLVAEEDGVIGFMLANLNHSLKKAELENLVVCEEQRHQWVGSRLVETMLEEIKKFNIENVVGLTNTLVQFLQRFGFQKWNAFVWMDLALSNTFKR